jgi:hypothetical protein
MAVTAFRLHLWSRAPGNRIPTATVDAQSNLHGAALALREFTQLGHDITVPGAHIDIEETNGPTHTMMMSEVLDWLRQPEQTEFVEEQNLGYLFGLTWPSRI